MHRWFLLLMIALLPLRGWVGEAMAGQMLQQRVAAVALAQGAPAQPVQQQQPPMALADHDCPGHGVSAGTPDAPQPDSAPADCPTCASCQVCSSVALALSTHATGSLALAQPVPSSRAIALRSAERALAFKPPIS